MRDFPALFDYRRVVEIQSVLGGPGGSKCLNPTVGAVLSTLGPLAG